MSGLDLGQILACDGDGCGGAKGPLRFGRDDARAARGEPVDETEPPGFETLTKAREAAATCGWISFWTLPSSGNGRKGRRLVDWCPACRAAHPGVEGTPVVVAARF